MNLYTFVTIDAARIVYVTETRENTVIGAFTDELASLGYDLNALKLICCDMWEPYLHAISWHLPHTSVVFDRFHITNGVVEGINSKIKTAMKRAYGFCPSNQMMRQ